MGKNIHSGERKQGGIGRLSLTAWLWAGSALLVCFGLLWTTPGAMAIDVVWPSISLTLKTSGLSLPVHIAHAGDGSGRLFVVEQAGRIRIIKGGLLLSTPFLDITPRVKCCSEQGLLSVAFPPGYSGKQYFYVYYINGGGDTVVARYHVTDNPDIADPESEEVILTVDQPFPNHNGGQLAFGFDGYLYIGLGDGGAGGDPFDNAKNPGTLLGKILRINVESGAPPYTVPNTNPFKNNAAFRPEIWAYGLRNPWRFSFDRWTGDLYIADVGQNTYEEVNYQPFSSAGGENYGWNIMEGAHCFNALVCSLSGLVLPVAEYDHTQGCSITGGMVYRGPSYAAMNGIYYYADYCSGKLFGLRRDDGSWSSSLLTDTPYSITSFGEDEAGNMYLTDYFNGAIYAMADANAVIPVPTGMHSFVYPSISLPVEGTDPSSIKPVGLGPVAEGGDVLDLKFWLFHFTAPVDIYIVFQIPSMGDDDVFILRPDNTIQPLSMGLVPWRSAVTGPIHESLFGQASIAGLPSGTYYFHLAATPAGSLESFYVWTTSVEIP